MSRARDLADSADLAFDGNTLKIDSTNNRVGIGTSSPLNPLHVYDGDILIEEPDANTSSGLKIANDSGSQLIIRGAGSSRVNPGCATGMPQIVSISGNDLYLSADGTDNIIFTTDRNEGMRIDSSGRVGIGTSSPNSSTKLHTYHATNNAQALFESGDSNVYIAFKDSNTSGDLYNRVGASGDDLQFYTNNLERMRIDSSGNLLVGKTTAAVATVGVGISGGLGVRATVDGNVGAIFNRLTSDGDIAIFRKDSSTIGRIGSYNDGASALFFADAGNVGIRLSQASTDDIVPCSSVGANRDAAINLGASNSRFKNLYLSGGVYLGGTGSANYLDDYEEGTFDPVLLGSTSDPTVSSYTNRYGYYVKVGRVVWVSFYMWCNNTVSGGSGAIQIGGIPFTIQNSGLGAYQFISMGYSAAGSTSTIIYPDTTSQTHANPRWQANNSNALYAYGKNNQNWGSYYELSGSGVLFVA